MKTWPIILLVLHFFAREPLWVLSMLSVVCMLGWPHLGIISSISLVCCNKCFSSSGPVLDPQEKSIGQHLCTCSNKGNSYYLSSPTGKVWRCLSFCFFFFKHWVFIAVRGFSLVVASRGYSLVAVCGLLISWLLLLWSTGSVGAVHGLSYPMACGIFPDQGSNLCPLHW